MEENRVESGRLRLIEHRVDTGFIFLVLGDAGELIKRDPNTPNLCQL